jgi:hypothetical protein
VFAVKELGRVGAVGSRLVLREFVNCVQSSAVVRSCFTSATEKVIKVSVLPRMYISGLLAGIEFGPRRDISLSDCHLTMWFCNTVVHPTVGQSLKVIVRGVFRKFSIVRIN